jgi:hypothetical protein
VTWIILLPVDAAVLALQEVEHPEGEQPAQDEVRGVTRLFRFADVAALDCLAAAGKKKRADNGGDRSAAGS